MDTLDITILRFLKNRTKKVLRYKMVEKELSLLPFLLLSPSLSVFPIHPSTERVSGAICDHDPSPNTGDHKGVIFQSWPRPPPAEGVRLRFKGRWETSEALFPLYPPPCRLPPRGQPFEGVITAACITWVTADGGWSQLMKPLKKPPLSWFLLKFWRAGARPGSQTITDVVMGGLWARVGLHFDC